MPHAQESATTSSPETYDVAIIGGGPAGLSAALVLGRACRRVILFDHGKPRNYAAQAVHGFLGLDGLRPHELRARARTQASAYDVELVDGEVVTATSQTGSESCPTLFHVATGDRLIDARALLIATGVTDKLPDIPGLRELYGHSVHHCPYCDGWEHRQKHLVALGESPSAAQLALMLRGWSHQVTVCTNGAPLPAQERAKLNEQKIGLREEKINRLQPGESSPVEICFQTGNGLPCEAVFFSADQAQQSPLAERLGCETQESGLLKTHHHQHTAVRGLFIAGDAGGSVQFAIAAAAEGAIAATQINKMLLEQDLPQLTT